MMKSPTLAAVAAVVGLTLAGGTAKADEACKAAFRTTVQPILNTNCVACHQDAAPGGGLSLQRTSALANLLGVPSQEAKMPRVTPGDPKKSYLFRKVAGTHLEAGIGGSGMQMPLGGKLAEGDMKAIAAWISSCKAD